MDYLGVDVNIAARLTELAGPDEVVASAETVEQLTATGWPFGASARCFAARGCPGNLAMFVRCALWLNKSGHALERDRGL